MSLKNIVVFLALLLTTFSCIKDTGHKGPGEQPVAIASSPYLLSVEEVAALLESPSPPLLIETSVAEIFSTGHIPGAINVWRPDYADDENYPFGGMRASREKMAQLLGHLGAKKEALIVVYCTKGSVDAARLQWILRSYGHDRVVIMDGGKAAWQHAGYPLVKAVSTNRVPTDYHFPGPEREDCFASLEEVVAAIRDTNIIIVDAREDYEHLGIPHLSNGRVVRHKAGAFAPGAIPGARHLNWSEAVDLHADHTFKSLADIKHNFLRQGITPDRKIIVYCHSGVRSAHTTFVLRQLLGFPNVKNYDGSWIEWSYVFASDTTGQLQHHTSPDEVEMIYHDLMADLQHENIE